MKEKLQKHLQSRLKSFEPDPLLQMRSWLDPFAIGISGGKRPLDSYQMGMRDAFQEILLSLDQIENAKE